MSVPFRIDDVVRWTGGEPLRGRRDASFSGVSTDTRSLIPDSLFVAVRGANHDAHDFLADAVAAGAGGLLVETERALPRALDAHLPVVAVDDTTRALGALAAGHRSGFDGPVVAVTGSNGKTTVKEMCAAILEVSAPILKNPGNWNNQFGLPLTLLRRESEHRRIVVEIGMSHRGEIAALAAIARPTVGVITNVGTAHIEHLGSRDEIALEKGDLVSGLAEDATAVLNADDPRTSAQSARTRARLLRFGRSPEADVRPLDRPCRTADGFAFDLETPQGRCTVKLPGLGEIAVENALAAAAAALAAGASLDDIALGLAAYRPVKGRMKPIALPGDRTIIDDTYNANPQSMEAALRSLATCKGAGRALAVLGDMGELGETASRAHRDVGRLVAELDIEYLFALGGHAETVCSAATEAGLDPAHAVAGRDHRDVAARVRAVLRANDWVLVKGSRAMEMERVVESLASGEGG